MSFSVIIPSKTISNLVPCVKAVRACEPGARIIVVDDGLASVVVPENVKFVMGVKPFVFARNVNIGIKAAGTDGVVLLNDDALLQTPGGFSAMAREAEEHPEFGIIGAVTNLTGQPLQRPQGVGLREVEHFAFVCVYIPRRTIKKIGMLDERYCLDYGVEDRDYCEACWRAGLKVGVYDFCYVDHGSLTSSFRGEPTTPRSFQQNLALFNQKWGLSA